MNTSVSTEPTEPIKAPVRTPGSRRFVRVAAPIAAAICVLLIPVPEGLSHNAWYYFALFVAVLVGIVTEPIPPAALGLLGVATAAAAGLVYDTPVRSSAWAVSGFANGTVWLIFAAFTLGLGYLKTGLGKRISLLLIRAMGRRTLGLGYAIAFADLALAPFMPSSTARSGGTIYSVIRSIPEIYGSRPNDPSARRIGAYLMYTALATTCVTSSMFLTALSTNLLAIGMVAKASAAPISWTMWFVGFAPVGIILFSLTPFLLFKIYPPEIREAPEAPRWAAEELRKMGPVTRRELTLLALVILALSLWIGGAQYLDATMAAFLVVALMVVFGVVNWTDVIGNAPAWNVLIWFGTLVTLASGLAEVKFVDWVAQSLAPTFAGHSAIVSAILLVGAFYFVHYLFASSTAHVSALFPAFFAIALKLPGLSPVAWALLLSYTIGFMGILTAYATGPSPIYYGSGYIRGKDFWVLGFILGMFFFAIYITVGLPWLVFLKL